MNTSILNSSQRWNKQHCEPRPMRVLRSRLQYPSKQHCVRPLLRRSSSTLQRRPWSIRLRTVAEIRVEERTAAELQSQFETVFDKDEMIDVNRYTRDYSDKGVTTRWGGPGTNCLRGDMQIVVKMMTGRKITFDVGDQRHHRQGRHPSRTAVINLRRKTARRRKDTVGLQHPEGQALRCTTSRRSTMI